MKFAKEFSEITLPALEFADLSYLDDTRCELIFSSKILAEDGHSQIISLCGLATKDIEFFQIRDPGCVFFRIQFQSTLLSVMREKIRKNTAFIKPEEDFVYKSLRGGIYNYFYRFIEELIDPVKNKFPKRCGEMKNYTVTGNGVFARFDSSSDALAKKPQYTPFDKQGFGNFQSLSLGMTDFFPPVFGFSKRPVLAGFMCNLKGVLLSNRLYIYDGGTVNRCYDFSSFDDAKNYYKRVRKDKILFARDELEAFKEAIRKAGKKTHNEALARLRWVPEAKIFIGADNLESRLLAMQYAKILETALKAANFCGEDYQIPIVFYLPENNELLFKYYSRDEYILDELEARAIYNNRVSRHQHYSKEKFEFLFILSAEECSEALKEEIENLPLGILLLQKGHVHIYRILSEKCRFYLEPFIFKKIENRLDYESILSTILKEAVRCVSLPIVKTVIQRIREIQPTELILQALKEQSMPIARLLLASKKFELKAVDKDNILKQALKNNYLEFIALLMDLKKGPVKVKGQIFLSQTQKDINLVYFVLSYGKNIIDSISQWVIKNNIFQWAVLTGDILFIKVLFMYVANSEKSLLLYNTLELFYEKNLIYALQILFDTFVDLYHPLDELVRNNNFNILAFCFKNQGIREEYGNRLFISAVKYTRIHYIESSLFNGQNLEFRDENRQTALHWAVKGKSLELVRLLIAQGANIHTRDKYGKTPLFYALKPCSIAMIKLLLEAGADIDSRDRDNNTALMLVIQENHFDSEPLIQLLLDNNANIYLMNIDGADALYFAKDKTFHLLSNMHRAKEILKEASPQNSDPLAHRFAKIFDAYAHPPLFSFSWRSHRELAACIARHLYQQRDWDFDRCYQYVLEQTTKIPKEEYNPHGTFACLLKEARQMGRALVLEKSIM